MKVAALDDMPALLPYAVQYWETFAFLSERRGWSEEGRPFFIPVSEILAYATFYGIDDEWEREMLLSMVAALDKEYVSYKSEIVKKNREAADRKSAQARRQR
jgi:hypothetical protein